MGEFKTDKQDPSLTTRNITAAPHFTFAPPCTLSSHPQPTPLSLPKISPPRRTCPSLQQLLVAVDRDACMRVIIAKHLTVQDRRLLGQGLRLIELTLSLKQQSRGCSSR